jgi:hypothetical protein
VVCLASGGQLRQTGSKLDRPLARPVEVWGVRCDGAEWVVRVDGVLSMSLAWQHTSMSLAVSMSLACRATRKSVRMLHLIVL